MKEMGHKNTPELANTVALVAKELTNIFKNCLHDVGQKLGVDQKVEANTRRHFGHD